MGIPAVFAIARQLINVAKEVEGRSQAISGRRDAASANLGTGRRPDPLRYHLRACVAVPHTSNSAMVGVNAPVLLIVHKRKSCTKSGHQ